jgi:hypothetical protein
MSLGARQIAVTGVLPVGCVPAQPLISGGSPVAVVSEDLNQLALLYHRQLNQDVDKQATRRFHDVNLVYLDLYAILANIDLYTSLLSIQIFDVIYAIRLMCVYLFLGWPDEGFKRARVPAAGSSGWSQVYSYCTISSAQCTRTRTSMCSRMVTTLREGVQNRNR